MNLGEIMETAQTYLDDPRGRRWDKPRLRRLINGAIRDVSREIRKSNKSFFSSIKDYAVVSATDTLEFTLPADFMLAVTVERLVSGGEPIPVVFSDFSARHTGEDTRFLPAGVKTASTVTFRGNKLCVVAPSESYTLRLIYSRSLPDLVEDVDVPEIPAEYHDIVALQAAKKAFASEGGNFPRDLEQLRGEGFRDMRESLENRRNTGPRYVNVQD